MDKLDVVVMALEEGSAVSTRDLSGKGVALFNAGLPGKNVGIG